MKECSYKDIKDFMSFDECKKLRLTKFYVSTKYEGFCIGVNLNTGEYLVINEPQTLTISEETHIWSLTGIRVKSIVFDDLEDIIETSDYNQRTDVFFISIAFVIIVIGFLTLYYYYYSK